MDTGDNRRDWRVTAGAAAVVGLAVGWFLLSHFVMGTDAPDAFGEALGAALGLLVAISVVGAILSARSARKHS
jgi:uncharacterized membrane protein YccC